MRLAEYRQAFRDALILGDDLMAAYWEVKDLRDSMGLSIEELDELHGDVLREVRAEGHPICD